MKVSSILTALTIAASSWTALALPASASNDLSDRDDISKRNPPLGSGVNILYDNTGLVKVFGVLRLTPTMFSIFYEAVGGSGNGAQEVAKNLYNHCLQTVSNDLNYNEIIRQVASKALSGTQAVYGIWNTANFPAPFTTGMMIDVAMASGEGPNYPLFIAFSHALQAYFSSQGVQVNIQEVTPQVLDTIGPGFPNQKREVNDAQEVQNAMKRRSQDQICATPIDIRQFFTGDAPDPPNQTTQC